MTLPHRLAVAGLIGLCGLAVMIAILLDGRGPQPDAARFCISAVFGAVLAGGVTAPLFGRLGRRGYRFAVLGGVAATLGGAALGGAAFEFATNPLAGLVLGPVLVLESIVRLPLVALVLVGSFTLIHLAARRLRGGSERGVSP